MHIVIVQGPFVLSKFVYAPSLERSLNKFLLKVVFL